MQSLLIKLQSINIKYGEREEDTEIHRDWIPISSESAL